MPNYKRPRHAGACIFITVALADRSLDLLTREVYSLRAAMRQTQAKWPFTINAIVILPDHFHTILTLPDGDADYSTRVRLIKARFSRQIGKGNLRESHIRRAERGIWQRRFWDHRIRDANDYRAHVEYCWHNPVKHGLVAHPMEWPHSSIHPDARMGNVPKEWMRLENGNP